MADRNPLVVPAMANIPMHSSPSVPCIVANESIVHLSEVQPGRMAIVFAMWNGATTQGYAAYQDVEDVEIMINVLQHAVENVRRFDRGEPMLDPLTDPVSKH